MRGSRERGWRLAIVAVALAVRVGYVAFFASRHLPLADPLSYHLLGNVIASGHGFVNPLLYTFGRRAVPTASEPPLFPLVLAAGSVLGARTVLWHQLLGAALGTLTVLGVGAVGRSVAGARAGLLAGGVAALYPPLWLNDGGITAESLFALLIVAVLVLAYRFARRPSLVGAAALGIAIGLAALTRVEAVLLVPLLLLPLMGIRTGEHMTNGTWRTAAIRAIVAVGAAALVVSPWVVRNLATFDRPSLLSTGDGTVAGANCAPAYDGPKIGLWVISCYGAPAPGDESDANAAWRRQGVAYATHHPGRATLVAAVRVGRLWQVFGPLQDARVNRDDGRPSWMNMLALATYAAVLALAAAGCVVLRRRRVRLLPLAAQAVLVTVTAASVWGAVRFRSPADVAMTVLAGVALDRLVAPRAELSPHPVTMGSCP